MAAAGRRDLNWRITWEKKKVVSSCSSSETRSSPATDCHQVELFWSARDAGLWEVAGLEESQVKHSTAAPEGEEMGQNSSGAR